MKKNVLALSIAAAVAGFGAMGSAHAITTVTAKGGTVWSDGTIGSTTEPIPVNGPVVSGSAVVATLPGTDATFLKLNPSAIGHILVSPYFTTQERNITLISIVNTDPTNGKAVKVRIRGAGNSDDLFDFQVFLSPNDVWTANISKGADGVSQIFTKDGSCMKGLTKNVASSFSKLRLDKKVPTDPLVAPTLGNQTREGYVEIFNMADIAPKLWVDAVTAISGTVTATSAAGWGAADNPIYTGILHTAGVAPCTGLGGLDTDALAWSGLTNPTTGLTGEWLIINQETAAGYGGNHTAIQALNNNYFPARGNVVYWPQTKVVFSGWPSSKFTADPLLAGDLFASGTFQVIPAVLPLLQDFPDLSTPYTWTALDYAAHVTAVSYPAGTIGVSGDASAGPAFQAFDLTRSLAVTSVSNEFLTDPDVKAATDFVFSMPTRRYSASLNYETLLPIYNNFSRFTVSSPYSSLVNFFSVANTQASSRQLCVWGLAQTAYDRNEQKPSSVVPSPQSIPMFCGEVSVFGINQSILPVTGISKVLGANIAVQGADVGTSNYAEGWLKVSTPGLYYGYSYGLPILGSAFTQAVGSTSGSNFGVNADHRATRHPFFIF